MNEKNTENTVKYYTSKEDFYKKKAVSEGFEEYLEASMKTFRFVKTSRSKMLYECPNQSGWEIWDLHLPNPGIKGKNAFRLLCICNKKSKEVYLAYLFPRDELPYKGAKNKLGGERWERRVEELKKHIQHMRLENDTRENSPNPLSTQKTERPAE